MNEQERIRRCVLIGYLGCGKTSIFNKLCKQKQKANSSLKSNTLKISESQTKFGKPNFLLVDTPGMGAIDAVFTHAVNMVAALTDGVINRILVVIKFDTRLDMISKQIKEVIHIVKAHSNLITIIINYLDQCKDDKQEFARECKQMISERFDIKSVIFTELRADGQQLCQAIEKELDSNFQQIQISDDLFNNLMSQLEFSKELEEGKQKFLEEFQLFYNSIQRFLEQFDFKNKDQDQILHSLHNFIRYYALKIQENFQKKYGNVMEVIYSKKNDPILAYQFYTVLKYSIKSQVQELIDIINKNMIYPLNHPFRDQRECPHCGVVWYKVLGCNDIYCGKKVKQTEEKEALQKVRQTYKDFKFTYENKMIKFHELKQEAETSKQEKSLISLNDSEQQLIRSQCVRGLEYQRAPSDQQNVLITEASTPKIISLKEPIVVNNYKPTKINVKPINTPFIINQKTDQQQLPIQNLNPIVNVKADIIPINTPPQANILKQKSSEQQLPIKNKNPLIQKEPQKRRNQTPQIQNQNPLQNYIPQKNINIKKISIQQLPNQNQNPLCQQQPVITPQVDSYNNINHRISGSQQINQPQARINWFDEFNYRDPHGLSEYELEQIKQKKQIGCGKKFKWDDARILKLEEIELRHEQLYQFYNLKDLKYKTEFDVIKNSLIEKAKEEKQIL